MARRKNSLDAGLGSAVARKMRCVTQSVAAQALNAREAKPLIDSSGSDELRSHLDPIVLMGSISLNPKLLMG